MILLLFFISSFLVVYTFIGYPIVLTLWPKKKNAIPSLEKLPPLSVIMIAYNEEKRILDKIDNIFSADYPAESLELIIASDGSNDNMIEKIEALADQRINILDFEQRRGKAACLNDAIAAASHEMLILCDVRQKIDKQAFKKLAETLSQDTVGAVSGELLFAQEGHNDFSQGMDAYWRLEKHIRQQEAAIDSVVGVTGALYALKKSCFQPIPSGTILDDVLIPMNVVLQDKKVLFCNSAHAIDVPSADPVHEKRRKRRTLAGNYQLLELNPNLFNPLRNRLFIQFISHKILRLLAPYFLLLVFISNLFILSYGSFFWFTLIAQLVFYGSAIAGSCNAKMKKNKLVRLSSAFISLNWFAVLGLVEYLKTEKTYLW